MIFTNESDMRWLLIVFEATIGLMLVLGSRRQPFPTPSKRFGTLTLLITLGFTVGQSAPHPVSVSGHLATLALLGAFGIVAGVHHMMVTRREVLIAPMSGFMFCVGMTGLIIQTWPDLSLGEQWAGFFSLIVLAACQTWLVFRGLLIGRLPLAWSQAGMVALQRGQLDGTHGAISCFEKGWDADEEHLNPMAYLALHRIYLFMQDVEEADKWLDSLVDVGGENAVAREWIEAIHECLVSIDPNAAKNLPVLNEEE
jgi:hypothetical protein